MAIKKQTTVSFIATNGTSFTTEIDAKAESLVHFAEKVLEFKEVDWKNETEESDESGLIKFLYENKDSLEEIFNWHEEVSNIGKFKMQPLNED